MMDFTEYSYDYMNRFEYDLDSMDQFLESSIVNFGLFRKIILRINNLK